jgi:hypothetical protein
MPTTNRGQYLCHNAEERITRRKPMARTYSDIREQSYTGSNEMRRTKDSAMMVLSPAAMIAETPEADETKGGGAG